MPKYTENDLQTALTRVYKGTPIKQVARQLQVLESTIRNRLKGHAPRSLAYAPYQRLLPEQEKALVHWVLGQDMLGSPPTYA